MNHSHSPIAEVYDLAVIGGGINGAGIAADAAGRGLSVFLCEKDDLAQHTSSASSKLIHGGLRYLEHHEFRLVREALAEREVLLAKAPHIIKPMRFILPHRPHLRPAWMIRAGLFLYDHLGKRERLPASRSLRFGPGSPLHRYRSWSPSLSKSAHATPRPTPWFARMNGVTFENQSRPSLRSSALALSGPSCVETYRSTIPSLS